MNGKDLLLLLAGGTLLYILGSTAPKRPSMTITPTPLDPNANLSPMASTAHSYPDPSMAPLLDEAALYVAQAQMSPDQLYQSIMTQGLTR